MKQLLIISFILNVILVYFLFSREPQEVIVERKIIETHPAPKNMVDMRKVVQPEVKKITKTKEEDTPPPPMDAPSMLPQEFQDAAERMEMDKIDFFTIKLGVPEEKLKEHNRLKEEFYLKSSKVWGKNPLAEPSIESRKKVLKLEEKLYSDLERLHGKENWERYKKFREEYNQKGFKRQEEDNQPFIFMEL